MGAGHNRSVPAIKPSALAVLTLAAAFVLSPAESEAQRRPPATTQWFSIVNEAGLCLDVHGEDLGRDGARVQMWPCHGGPNQLWRFDRGMLLSASGGCLDVHGDDVGRPGGRVQMWSCHGASNQQWMVQPNDALTSSSGGCLDIEGGAVHTAGTRVIMWTCHGAVNQRFALRAAPAALPSPTPRVAFHRGAASIDAPAFEALLVRVRGAPFSSEKLAAVQDAARWHWFTAEQIARIVGELAFSPDRTQAIEILAPRLVDPQNGAVILDRLTFSSERDSARATLSRHAR